MESWKRTALVEREPRGKDVMIRYSKTRVFLLIAVFVFPLTCFGQDPNATKEWRADVNLYMLAASMSGNTTIHGVPVDVDVPFSNVMSNLQFGFMGRATGYHRRWAVSTDVIYMGLGTVKNNIDVGFDQWLVQPMVEYEATSWISPYAGTRYMNLTGDFKTPSGITRSGKQSWWDPVIGAELRIPISSNFRAVVRGDVGGFGAASSFTDQIEPMLDWRFKKWCSLQFGYRWFYDDYQTGSGTNKFRYDMLIQGPQFGATLHF